MNPIGGRSSAGCGCLNAQAHIAQDLCAAERRADALDADTNRADAEDIAVTQGQHVCASATAARRARMKPVMALESMTPERVDEHEQLRFDPSGQLKMDLVPEAQAIANAAVDDFHSSPRREMPEPTDVEPQRGRVRHEGPRSGPIDA
jgi:hypothetical protein